MGQDDVDGDVNGKVSTTTHHFYDVDDEHGKWSESLGSVLPNLNEGEDESEEAEADVCAFPSFATSLVGTWFGILFTRGLTPPAQQEHPRCDPRLPGCRMCLPTGRQRDPQCPTSTKSEQSMLG